MPERFHVKCMTQPADPQGIYALIQSGRAKAAIKAAKAAIRKHPRQAVLPNLMGIAQSSSGDLRGSLLSFQKALKLDPGFDDARKNMAQSLMLLGRTDKAEALLSDLARRRSGDAGVLYQLAQLRAKTGDLPGARDAADQAIAADPKLGQAYTLRALIRDRQEGPAGALEDYETALRINPGDINALVNISLPLSRLGRHSEGRPRVEQAVARQPEHRGALTRLAMMKTEIGETDAAKHLQQQVLNAEPHDTHALAALAKLLPAAEARPLVPQIEKARRKAEANPHDAGLLTFALADIARANGDMDAEARWLTQANQLMAQVAPFDVTRDQHEHDTVVARFPNRQSVPDAVDKTMPTPIFVMGLPRSGTSLTETILGGHDEVVGLGELATAGILLQQTLRDNVTFGPADADTLAADYRKALPPLPTGTRAFVDKMPDNYKLMGFLKAAFPEARFIHLNRDPRAIALSLWRTSLSGSALSFSYDLEAMAHHANAYQRLIHHWQALFGPALFQLDYETLVSDVTTTSQALAAHCGLTWQPQMAHPEHSTAPVTTASATQVREKVHVRSVDQWRAYETMLAPFINTLDPALWHEIPPHRVQTTP